jgi:hypothetical protein
MLESLVGQRANRVRESDDEDLSGLLVMARYVSDRAKL